MLRILCSLSALSFIIVAFIIAAFAPYANAQVSGPPNDAPVLGPADPREAAFNQCLDSAVDDPLTGVDTANKWLSVGGSYFARHCLAFAYSRQKRWLLSSEAFAKAAQEAGQAGDERTANLWVQAANAALAGNQPSTALAHLDSAIASNILQGQALGLAHLDRARALVALEQLQAAQAEFTLVQKYAPDDPLGWLLSATLERRLDNLERAASDINVALSIVPQDADVMLEAGVIAALTGDYDAAKTYWNSITAQTRPSAAKLSARQYLKQLEDTPDDEAAQ
jgi:Tfp pilus assembly protein PilF